MSNKGFTLIELIVTLAILSLILIISIPLINNALDQSRNKTYDMLKDNMLTAAENYLIECRNNPSSTVCTTQNWSNTSFTFTASELLNSGFLNVPSDLLKNTASGKRIYNPSNNKDISNCLKVNVTIVNHQYEYQIDEATCHE